jgi:riboflavin transporter FmnP
MAETSKSRWISLVAILTALASVLNFTVEVPAPYLPFLQYEVWEVPILLAALLLGLTGGLTVAALNTLVLEVHPGVLPSGPVYNLIAQVAMMLGVLGALRIARRGRGRVAWSWGAATCAGSLARTAVMTVVNAYVLPQPAPIGFSLPGPTVVADLPLIAAFNFTVALYTVPLALASCRAVVSRTHFRGNSSWAEVPHSAV